MTSNFPTSADSIANNVVNSTPEVNTHPNLHNQLADAVNAVETALLPGGSMNLAAHVAAADPHSVYLTQPEGDARYAAIGSGGGGAPSGPAGGALSGTYPNPTLAADSVSSANIASKTITAADIADGVIALNSTLIADGAINAAKIQDGTITSTKIADGTISTNDFANLAITSAAIANDAIVNRTIADNAVNTAELADGAVTSAKIADGTIAAGDLAAGVAASNVGTLGGSLAGTLPNPTLAANSVGASQITDGTVGTAELANAAVTNAKLASDTARANLLTNGGFEIWQRGTGPFTTPAAAWTADRWAMSAAGTDALSVSRDGANQDAGSFYCAACTVTVGTGAGNSWFFQQISVNADGPQSLRGRTISFSVRVRTSTANAVRIHYTDAAGTSTYSAYHSGGGTYETLTLTATWPLSGATILQIGLAFSASCTAYIDNAMLVVGSQPADYAPLHPADDLARCLRYYEILGGNLASGVLILSEECPAGALNLRATFSYKVTKAVTPTATKMGTWTVGNSGQPSVSATGTDAAWVSATALAAGDAYTYNGAAGTGITLEANP